MKPTASACRFASRVCSTLRRLPRPQQPTSNAPAAVMVARYFDALSARKGVVKHGR